jgi:hypothetical protein
MPRSKEPLMYADEMLALKGGQGNFTRGPKRKGNKGRKSVYKPGILTGILNTKLSDAEFAVLTYFGRGRRARGLRRILTALRVGMSFIPEFEAEAHAAVVLPKNQPLSDARVNKACRLMGRMWAASSTEWDDI